MCYAFGDSAVAAERLALVAQVFEGPSRTFWCSFAPAGPRLALDLGCGPGHTTRALAQSVGATQTVGMGLAVRSAAPRNSAEESPIS
ncbi:MAG TPA: class I SAM-dependent methyltransferase [Myxococcota bacterium]|nr:class I SAM-dependent methyltransferase [Myxococcota bacterium]